MQRIEAAPANTPAETQTPKRTRLHNRLSIGARTADNPPIFPIICLVLLTRPAMNNRAFGRAALGYLQVQHGRDFSRRRRPAGRTSANQRWVLNNGFGIRSTAGKTARPAVHIRQNSVNLLHLWVHLHLQFNARRQQHHRKQQPQYYHQQC